MEHDCTEGCDGSHRHKWEIEPHPHDSGFDVFVCDKDEDALEALRAVAERVWDCISDGEERVIRIRLNRASESEFGN